MGNTKLQTSGSCSCSRQRSWRHCRQLNLELQPELPELKSTWAIGKWLFCSLPLCGARLCVSLSVSTAGPCVLNPQVASGSSWSGSLFHCQSVCLCVCLSAPLSVIQLVRQLAYKFAYHVWVWLCCLFESFSHLLSMEALQLQPNSLLGTSLHCEARDDTRHTIVPSRSALSSRIVSCRIA